jgi:hypothetical protein
MKRLILFAALAAMALPAGAAKRVTVAQLEQALAALGASHKADAEMARQIGGMEPTERITELALARLEAHLAPGSKAAQAVKLLADQSAFLDPPGSELPAAAAPDDAGQQKMLAQARNYVLQTLPRLPNFLANRTINRYDDSPQAPKDGGWPVRVGLHRVDTSSREISVRDERENQPPTQGAAVWQQQIGLISGGEFGNTLGMILTDTLKGSVSWSHWEQAGATTQAVFRYAVPAAVSHFEVIGTFQRQAAIEGRATSTGGARGTMGIGIQQNYDPSRVSMVRVRPAYHGSLWLDPATGTILRITMEAELKESAPFRRAAILVEYGSVQIGDALFTCPVRSVALSLAALGAPGGSEDAPTEWLNETLFTGYHRFASTTRILDETPPPEPALQPDADSKPK